MSAVAYEELYDPIDVNASVLLNAVPLARAANVTKKFYYCIFQIKLTFARPPGTKVLNAAKSIARTVEY